MSELIDNHAQKKALLKRLLKRVQGEGEDLALSQELVALMGQVPHELVIEAEQELIEEGSLSTSGLTRPCDLHSQALKGALKPGINRTLEPQHPLSAYFLENRAIEQTIDRLEAALEGCLKPECQAGLAQLQADLERLLEVERHYKRKEGLLFPYLEKKGITGPSSVMWAKDDEILKELRLAKAIAREAGTGELGDVERLKAALKPAMESMREMIFKEERILFPACMDVLSEEEWAEVDRQSKEIGYCLIEPKGMFEPAKKGGSMEDWEPSKEIRMQTGGMSFKELEAILSSLPVDITFVDKNDAVAYFSQTKDRVFLRSKAILGRKVQLCHPPASVHIVQRILADFKSGRQDKAAFWINYQERFIHIEYFALRSQEGEYLGVLEATQDLTQKRVLEGERRLLFYETN